MESGSSGQNRSARKSIFREDTVQQPSLQNLNSLVRVVSPLDWLPVAFAGVSLSAALLWSIFGRIPVKVSGIGVLSNPLQVVDLESSVTGQVTEIHVTAGSHVEKDQIIATVYSSEIEKRLELEKNKLSQLQVQVREIEAIRDRRSALELETIAQELIANQEQLQIAREMSAAIRARGEELLEQRRSSLKQQLEDAVTISPTLKERWDKRRLLAKEGALSGDQVLTSMQEYRENIQQIATLQADLKDLDVREVEIRQEYLESTNTVSRLKADLRDLEVREKRVEQDNLEFITVRRNEIEDTKREIAELERQYLDNRHIKSPVAGRIVELTTSVGSVVLQGTRLVTLEADGVQAQTSNVAYFSVRDGKRIRPGMKIQVTPDTVLRERFGGIVGTVSSVSNFPITQEGVISTVGNIDFVTVLSARNEPMIEVRGLLTRDSSTPSGYLWSSSQGPASSSISRGTTTTTTVTIEERAPIGFLLPTLRRWSGLY